ncbi:hypothetical protein KPSA1_06672 [Pseudomonas syringae pv. actinidiae]|uniref:Uncharacterized protein n=1 Tax=Pseudomonas syringae pv. actinidiae TaxID=103796 RepID=A0A2V0QJQ6_PSESF|nr:hypothetical protein KPSA1_06672 [Pseudomonas syringae pv. actinidiae]
MFTTATANDQNIHFKNLDDADSGVRGVSEKINTAIRGRNGVGVCKADGASLSGVAFWQ